MKSSNHILKKIIIKFINTTYEVNDGKLYDFNSKLIICPHDISKTIEVIFAIDYEFAYLIIFEWLYEIGFKNITSNWYTTVRYDIFDDTVYSVSNISTNNLTTAQIHRIKMYYE
jgi:hypothetical protein